MTDVDTNKPLVQGGTIGILGGGQLGRMLSVAASRLGYRCHIYEPDLHPPAGHVAEDVTTAAYDNTAALERFAALCDVVTYEFESIPTRALDLLQDQRPIRPGRKALWVSQDRLVEKRFLRDLDLPTAPFLPVTSSSELISAASKLGLPSILKTRRYGYDGKGQMRIEKAEDVNTAWTAVSGAKSILEGFVEFSCEISVIAARGLDGQVVCYDPGENIHKDGILRQTTVPASVSNTIKTDAVLIAGKILNALDYVGVLGVELFVTDAGLVVNEIAPRVHNSGHWTQNGCAVDQFEQHIRAITGLPLGNGQRTSDVVMQNLIGEECRQLQNHMTDPDTSIHLYGKDVAKAGRKMGHVNRSTPRSQ